MFTVLPAKCRVRNADLDKGEAFDNVLPRQDYDTLQGSKVDEDGVVLND
jgi:hypothetical protein